MARWRRSRDLGQQRLEHPRPLLASAVLVKQSQIRAIPELRDWQVQAWDYYDRVGELRFAVQWIANALSRCRLYVGLPDEYGHAPDPIGQGNAADADERATIPLEEMFGGQAGQAEMLSRLAMHLTVAGESYLIAFDDESGSRRWMVASSEEFTRSAGNQVRVRLPESDRQIPIKLDQSTVIRLWRQHPRRAWESDSPVRASLSILRELVELSAHISATVESRLAGAGLLLLPESATLPSPLNQHGEPLHEDPAMATLIDSMITPIGDRDSSAAVVPIIVRIPDQATGKPQWMTFSTPFDERVQDLRESSIQRFASIVDIPAEVLTGFSSANRWNAWKISEDAIKIHLEPLLDLICDALTTQYLWPALEALGVPDPQQFVIWYDASDLILRPNRGPESQNLYEHGLVNGRTVRRANGFTDDDAPDDDEQRTILLTQLASRGIDPYLAAPYLKALGIELDLSAVPQSLADDVEGGIVRGVDDSTAPPGSRVRGRPAAPTRLPTRPEPLPANPDTVDRSEVISSSALAETLDFAMIEYASVQALSHAGKRLMRNTTRAGRTRLLGLNAWDIYTHTPTPSESDLGTALEGAYDELRACLPHSPCIHRVVDAYVRDRLTSQQPHDRAVLLTYVADAGCLSPGGGERAIA